MRFQSVVAIVFALTSQLSAQVVYGPGEPATQPANQLLAPTLAPPGGEALDVVFVMDGSGSIPPDAFQYQKDGIKNCIVGPDAFLPTDGSVAISVIQFSTDSQVHIHLAVIDSPSTAATIASAIDAIGQLSGGTNLFSGLESAVDELKAGFGNDRLIVVSTDTDPSGNTNVIDLGEHIRTGTGIASGLGQTRICTVFIAPCSSPPESTPNDLGVTRFPLCGFPLFPSHQRQIRI